MWRPASAFLPCQHLWKLATRTHKVLNSTCAWTIWLRGHGPVCVVVNRALLEFPSRENLFGFLVLQKGLSSARRIFLIPGLMPLFPDNSLSRSLFLIAFLGACCAWTWWEFQMAPRRFLDWSTRTLTNIGSSGTVDTYWISASFLSKRRLSLFFSFSIAFLVRLCWTTSDLSSSCIFSLCKCGHR